MKNNRGQVTIPKQSIHDISIDSAEGKQMVKSVRNALQDCHDACAAVFSRNLSSTSKKADYSSKYFTGVEEILLQKSKEPGLAPVFKEGFLKAAAEFKANGEYMSQRVISEFPYILEMEKNERINAMFQAILDLCTPMYLFHCINFSSEAEVANYLSKYFIGVGEGILQCADKEGEYEIPPEFKEDSAPLAEKFKKLGEALSKGDPLRVREIIESR